MIVQLLFIASIASETILASPHGPLKPVDSIYKRATSPDNICGASNSGFTCDPSSPNGGPCCSSHGFCGSSDTYCGTGCQPEYGTCGNNPATPTSHGSGSACTTVPGVGFFTEHSFFEFTSSSLPSALVPSGGDPYGDPSEPYTQQMVKEDVTISPPYLQLTVPGGQKASPIKGAEIATSFSDILYASVRTRAIFSSVPGTCHGLFFFKSDKQEIDIEYLTDPASTSNPGNGSISLQLTNQAADGIHEHETYKLAASPKDPSTEEHEYRIDWTSESTSFWVDGVRVTDPFTTNVPTEAGSWLWNNWSNGDKGWSAGPPQTDSVLKIRSIEMFYNRTSTAGSC
ncbi:MAG: hypothetical protein M1820_004129 [Bogoriella megaspora]|nr:MAG: hypothetical protein M1820_004129 [Bogoriella megaspora]